MDNKDTEHLEQTIKELSKISTAPDKETPDWMETDIRRGYMAGYEYAMGKVQEKDKEIERLKASIWNGVFRNDEISPAFKATIQETEAVLNASKNIK